jgi:hypothetical protein
MNHYSTPFAVPTNVAASAAVGPAAPTGWVVLSGVSIAETAGTATRIEIRDGQSATGNIVAAFNLAGNASLNPGEMSNVNVPGGIYVKVIGAGTLIGSVYIR